MDHYRLRHVASLVAAVAAVNWLSAQTQAKTTYYVAPSGSDTNPGSSTRPFQTISKAAGILEPGDRCILRPGVYRETVVPSGSGTDSSPIVFAAAPGADVEVTGSDPVGGWQLYKGHIYEAPVRGLQGNAQVYTRDSSGLHALLEARWPHIASGSLSSIRAGMATMTAGSNTTITDSALNQPDGFWNGATVWCRGGVGWLAQTSTVRRFDAASHTLHTNGFTAGSILDPSAGSTYYITNCLNALDSPGEFYYDQSAGELYVWAADGNVPTNIEVKSRNTAFDLDNRSNIVLRGLKLEAANVTLNKATNCELDGISDSYVAYADTSQSYLPDNQVESGISIHGDGNVIRNSEIAYSTGCLVSIHGNGNRIINDYLHDADTLGSYAPLIYMAQGQRNLISNNTLTESGRFGILFASSNCNIQYNEISNYMWLSSDGGAVYGWGVDLKNSEIDHNVIHDSRGYSLGCGVYIDNFDENVIIDHNVIYNIDDAGIKLNTPSSYELIFNNTVDRCKNSVEYWGEAPYQDDLYAARFDNNIFTAPALIPPSCAQNNDVAGHGLTFRDASSGDYRLVHDPASCGAYSGGDPNWKAGWNPASQPNPVYAAPDYLYMNRVQNSGFESGLDGWTMTGCAMATTISVGGASGWKKRGLDNALSLGTGVNGVVQTVRGLKPNSDYRLTAWVYAEPGETYSLSVSSYGGAPVQISDSNALYERREIAFRTGPTYTTADILLTKTSAGSGSVIADDFGLAEDPGGVH